MNEAISSGQFYIGRFLLCRSLDRLGMTEREATPKDDKGKDPVQDDGGGP